jgi:hypothetical protein
MEASPNTRYRYNIPDKIKSGRPEKEKCLQDLINALLDCYENYIALSKVTPSAVLRAAYNNYANMRTDYVYALYSNLSVYNGVFVDQTGNVTGLIDPVWSDTEIAIIYEEAAIFPAIITNELKAIKRYDMYLRNHIPIIPHLRLLTSQKNSIKQTVKFLSESINLY